MLLVLGTEAAAAEAQHRPGNSGAALCGEAALRAGGHERRRGQPAGLPGERFTLSYALSVIRSDGTATACTHVGEKRNEQLNWVHLSKAGFAQQAQRPGNRPYPVS